MKQLSVFLLLSFNIFAQQKASIKSPNQSVVLSVNNNTNGSLLYQIKYKNQPVIEPSALGFVLSKPQIVLNRFSIV